MKRTSNLRLLPVPHDGNPLFRPLLLRGTRLFVSDRPAPTKGRRAPTARVCLCGVHGTPQGGFRVGHALSMMSGSSEPRATQFQLVRPHGGRSYGRRALSLDRRSGVWGVGASGSCALQLDGKAPRPRSRPPRRGPRRCVSGSSSRETLRFVLFHIHCN